MIIRTINSKNLSILINAFEEVLLNHQIRYLTFGIAETEENIVFFFNDHKNDRYMIEFEPHECIGREHYDFAEEAMIPVLQHLKSTFH